MEHTLAEADVPRVVHVLADGNPRPHVLSAWFSPDCGRAEVSTRIRLESAQSVAAIAEMRDGRVWRADKALTVNFGACADVGSGTGILTEMFLQNGNVVYGVEPNQGMREAAERLLKAHPRFNSVAGQAEATTLDEASVDFITAGQAFHWFDAAASRTEFGRILRPDGFVALTWNARAYRDDPLLVFRSEAAQELTGLATGELAHPALSWPCFSPAQRGAGGVPAGTRGFGHQFTEFAFPTFSDASLAAFFLFPHRPPLLAPLWLLAPDGRALLLAPQDAFHEQVIAVPCGAVEAARGVRCGWSSAKATCVRRSSNGGVPWVCGRQARVLTQLAAGSRRGAGAAHPSRKASIGLPIAWWPLPDAWKRRRRCARP